MQRRQAPLEPGNKARGRSGADHHCAALRPSHSRTGPAAKASRCGWRCSNSNWWARRIFARPHRLVRGRQRNRSRMDSQSNDLFSWCGSNCRLVGFLLRTLGAVRANKYFAFHFRHPEKINQPVEAGRDRHGFEFGGHACDVTGSVELFFPRHCTVRRLVGASRRSRGSAPGGSPIFAFGFHETHLRGDPIKLSHLSSFAKSKRGQSRLPVLNVHFTQQIYFYHAIRRTAGPNMWRSRKPVALSRNLS